MTQRLRDARSNCDEEQVTKLVEQLSSGNDDLYWTWSDEYIAIFRERYDIANIQVSKYEDHDTYQSLEFIRFDIEQAILEIPNHAKRLPDPIHSLNIKRFKKDVDSALSSIEEMKISMLHNTLFPKRMIVYCLYSH